MLGSHIADFPLFSPDRETSRARREVNFDSSSPTRVPCVILGYLRPCHCHRASSPTTRRAHSYTVHGQHTKLQSSGSTPHFGARMSSYAWLGVVLAMRAGRVDHAASPPTSQHAPCVTFGSWPRGATMATLGADILKKYRSPRILFGRLSPPLFPFISFSSFN